MILHLLSSKTKPIAITLQHETIPPVYLPVYVFICVHLFNLPFSHYIIFVLQIVPVKASFVEYTVQECPEGVTERGTCRKLTLNSDTEVLQKVSVFKDVNLTY